MSADATARLPEGWRATSDALKDRVVLITGAAGGLGRASALAAASSGASVILLGRKVRPLEKLYDEIAALGRAQPAIYPMDLSGASPNDYADLAATIEKEFGRLDGIVHAAAHFDSLRPATNIAADEWMKSLHVNVSAPFLLTQACAPLLAKSDAASVVFVIDDPRTHAPRALGRLRRVETRASRTLAAILHDEWENSPCASTRCCRRRCAPRCGARRTMARIRWSCRRPATSHRPSSIC